jgi:leader peptidase (prepilin peptidase)/N-methyltransferase
MRDLFFIILLIFFGSLVGKFLNNLTYENFKDKESKISLRFFSICPNCKTKTKYFFIPFLDYILNKKKCLNCKYAFPITSLLIEIFTSLYYPLCYFYFFIYKKQPLNFIPPLFFGTILILISFIDIKNNIIPNKIVIPSIFIGLFLMILFFPNKIIESIIFSIGVFILFLLIYFVYPQGMGMGDVKLAALLGIFLGRDLITAIVLGFIFGAIYSIFLLISKNKRFKDRIPFAPFLSIGAIIAFFI